MKRHMPLLAMSAVLLVGCTEQRGEPTALDVAGSERLNAPARERVVIADRASGTISVIDTRTDEVTGTHDLPMEAGDAVPEPMYVVYSAPGHRVFVGDRANDRVAVFDAADFDVVGTVPAGRGVFHMWADPQGKQLWVNNDIDNTTSVIDAVALEVVATVDTPADLVMMGGKPHDVIVDPMGRHAYVTVLGLMGANDYVVQYSTGSFMETARAAVGKDPHLSLNRQGDDLYVPCQNTNEVIVLDRETLAMETTLSVPGAHGAGMTRNGRYFYTANLPGGGTDALFTIDTQSNTLVGDATDSPFPVPHNIALTASGRKLYLTHSGGTSDKVSVYSIGTADPTPEYVTDVTVGLNPFGIAYVP